MHLGSCDQLAKFDIANAYRVVTVHPQDKLLLGMVWRGDLYVDGASSANNTIYSEEAFVRLATVVAFDTRMIWAVSCLCFFASFRVWELTVSEQGYNASVHLRVGDVAIDDPVSPSFLHITIKQSKTDPFWKGVDLYVGRTETNLCPVAAILGYLRCRGMARGRWQTTVA